MAADAPNPASSVYAAAPPAESLIGNNPQSITTDWGRVGLILGDPKHANPHNPQFVPAHVTICSVFPATLRTPERVFRSAGFPQYILPVPPPNGFTCLRVYDTVAVVSDMNKVEDREWNGSDGQTLQPIPALDRSGYGGIAHDIIKILAGSYIGSNPNRMPGVGMLKGDLPTKAEFDHLHDIQTAFFRYFVAEADELHEKHKWNEIGHLHRFSLDQLGDHDPIRHPWHKEITKQSMKSCYGCGKLIMAMATTCEHCSRDLLELAISRYRLLGVNPVDAGDTILFRMVQQAIQREAQQETTFAPSSVNKPRPSSTAKQPE
jgi:hypothetical protein